MVFMKFWASVRLLSVAELIYQHIQNESRQFGVPLREDATPLSRNALVDGALMRV